MQSRKLFFSHIQVLPVRALLAANKRICKMARGWDCHLIFLPNTAVKQGHRRRAQNSENCIFL